ncbi:uridine kinase family protein [Solwaraspora sp. WMMB335]|uniref:uridine kinase family protein n=1 Tax=Solwaraspora sp. WMMB335 TaxID=3404118 RepID=UPI003B9334C0
MSGHEPDVSEHEPGMGGCDLGEGTVETFAGLVRRVSAGPACRNPTRLGPVRLVVIDGPSSAGKSTFADRLVEAWAAAPAGSTTRPNGRIALVRTDDLLDGWGDQFTFWPRLQEQVLAPLRAGRPARYRRYDWIAGRFSDGWVVVEPPDVLLVEGVSAARAAARAQAALSIFVTAPEPVRLARSLARDGAAMQPVLDRWRHAERGFFAADRTAAEVDLLVDGAALRPGDPPSYRRLDRGAEPAGGVAGDGAGAAPSAG